MSLKICTSGILIHGGKKGIPSPAEATIATSNSSLPVLPLLWPLWAWEHEGGQKAKVG